MTQIIREIRQSANLRHEVSPLEEDLIIEDNEADEILELN